MNISETEMNNMDNKETKVAKFPHPNFALAVGRTDTMFFNMPNCCQKIQKHTYTP